MKKLILFSGLPGVGKSTISREVSKNTGAKIVDLDDFKKIDVDPALVTKQIDPPELRWAYYQKALDHVFGLFDQGISTVIMDEVFHLDSLRNGLENLCVIHNVRVFWVDVRCPYEIVEKRLQSTKREGHLLSTEQALKMHLLFREIFEKFSINSQNHIVINNESDNDIDSLIRSILEKVG
ncbi:MAG: AAA family ATPase [Candidatus Staskawiczbacteria bacterium]|nr:AAA family ATPase [Candidatus Staskawiczbacteria bacterium]